MAGIEETFYGILSDDVVLKDLVGERIYQEIAPQQAAFPFLTYGRVSRENTPHLRGVSPLVQSRIQLQVWALDVLSRTAITRQLVTQDGQFGLVSRTTDVRRISITDVSDTFVPPTDGNEIGIFTTELSLALWYRES